MFWFWLYWLVLGGWVTFYLFEIGLLLFELA